MEITNTVEIDRLSKEGKECMFYNNPPEDAEPLVNPTVTETVVLYGVQNAKLLNIRDAPGGAVLSVVKKGDILGIVSGFETNKDWAEVRTRDGLKGWVMRSYIIPLYDGPIDDPERKPCTEEWPVS